MFSILPKKKNQDVFFGFILFLILIWNGYTLASDIDKGGGGVRFIDPLGRSSLWRLDPSRFPINENDHRLNCGGFERHWTKNKGKCGICGDPADGRKEHEIGGKYYSSYISRTFTQNTVVDIAIETTSNLNGYIEFRICDNADNKTVTRDCINNNILKIIGTEYPRYKILKPGFHVIPMQLPEKLHCKKCLLQLKYHTESRWGCDSGTCCFGCGKQEEFYSCADITIVPEATLTYKSRALNEREMYTKWWCVFQCADNECRSNVCSMYAHLRKKRQIVTNCKGTGVWENNAAMDNWCQLNCFSYCPELYCKCTGLESSETSTLPTTTTTLLTTPGLLNIYVTPSQATAVYGVSFYQIRCFVTGTPEPTNWFWTKTPVNGGTSTTLSRTTDNADYRVEQSATQPHLTIFGITGADEAVYVCHADNGAGLRSSTASRVDVIGGLLTVSVSPTEYTATVGDTNLRLECTVTGDPQAVSWYWTKTPLDGAPPLTIGRGVDNQDHNVAESATNPHLTIKNIAKEDAADYECYAVNIAGTSSSNTKARVFVKEAVPTVVRLLATAGCQYCNSRNNLTCAELYCSEEYLSSLTFSGSVTDKLNLLADEFCSVCYLNDTNCQKYFCFPNRQIVSLTIRARCNLCQTQTGIDCPSATECSSIAISVQILKSDVLEAQRISEFTCRGVRPIYNSNAMDAWCNTVCSYGVCPQQLCECGYFSETTSTPSTTTETTTTTTLTTTASKSVVDPYSINAMNRVMCSICSQNDVASICSNKYCDQYNQNLEDPSNYYNRVLSYSSSLFCDLATTEGNNGMKNIYCGSSQPAITSGVKTVLCNVCQNTQPGNQCDSYCF